MDSRERIIQTLLGQMVHVEVDRPIGYVHGSIVYPLNYGYLPGIPAGDGEDQDAYILGVSTPLTAFDGRVIGVVRRRNDCEDKLIVAPDGMRFHQAEIAQAVQFQEQYFDSFVVSLYEKSCGVLAYRMVDGVRKYLLVFQHYSQCWSLPKGHMEAGETEADTALRELREETGLTAQLDLSRCATIEYPISPLARKQVVFFSGQVDGEPTVCDREIESFRWVTAEALPHYLFPDTFAACASLLEESPE